MRVRGVCLDWFNSYVSDREQYVSVNNNNSSKCSIHAGVPRGYILGTLLFLLYINDMSACSDVFRFVHYTDDATAVIQGNCLGDICNLSNEKLSRLISGYVVSLNVSKSTFMMISNSSNINVPDIIVIHDPIHMWSVSGA